MENQTSGKNMQLNLYNILLNTLYVIHPRNVFSSLHSTACPCFDPENTREATQWLTLQQDEASDLLPCILKLK